MENNFDILIVGAGVAGAALANFMAETSLNIGIIEKDWNEKEGIIGELMQPGGVEKLKELGLLDCIQNIEAQTVSGYSIFFKGENIVIPYPQNKEGVGFRNGKFVHALRQKMRAQKNITCLEGTVLNLVETEEKITGVVFKNKAQEEQILSAKLVIVCEGAFSVLRKNCHKILPTITSHFVGYKLQNCELPNPNFGHVIVTDKTPVLFYPISETEVRVLIDVPLDVPPRRGEDLNQWLLSNVLPQLPEQLKPSLQVAIAEGKMQAMPNHILPAKPQLKSNLLLLGDSLNMRHPLTGGGMTVALTDVKLVGDYLKKINFADANSIQQAIQNFYANRYKDVASINILADALYQVFSHNKLKKACFYYLKKGGKFASEPVSLLGGISRKKSLLLYHFFSVAIYGAFQNNVPFFSVKKITEGKDFLATATKIVLPLIKNQKI